mmetsp:Transcript_62645/g.166239  ORF Transcript_62645/g.166239 Transcript_62645/m.166239 type:complete len:400 (-) Transcript_62645:94-1293(-)
MLVSSSSSHHWMKPGSSKRSANCSCGRVCHRESTLVLQNRHGWPDALEELCLKLGTPLVLRKSFSGRIGLNGRQEDEDPWGHGRYTRGSLARCPVATRVRMHRMTRQEAKGPAYARARQPLLLSAGDALEDFCFQIDAHTVFAPGWDDDILAQWADTDNEYAVLSTYPPDASDFRWERPQDGPWEVPHLCRAKLEGPGIVRTCDTTFARDLVRPVLAKFWAGGMSFSRCHAERDVPADPESRDIFWGEEFSRGARLWTNGYDLYSPSRPVIGVWYADERGNHPEDWIADEREAEVALARMRTLVRAPLSDQSCRARAELTGFDMGTRRDFQEYIELTGVDTVHNVVHNTSCAFTRWTPWHRDAQPAYEMLDQSPLQSGSAFCSEPPSVPLKVRRGVHER